MSAGRRKNMLIGFGAAAVVLAGAVAWLGPNLPYRSDDASGAIGAVQKHRAPQIAAQDVVLGNEQTKKEQQILYADYLNDAAALQNISASLNAANLEAAQQSLEARRSDLNARFMANADSALESVRQLGKADQAQLGAMAEDFQKANREQLEAADLEQYAARFLGMMDALNLNARVKSKALESISEAEAALAARNLSNVIEAESLAARIHAQAAYMEAMSKEAKVLEKAINTLEAKSLEAKSLEAKALEAKALEAKSLDAKALEAKSLDAKSLESMNADLMEAASQLQARAVQNMEYSLANYGEWSMALGKASQNLEAAANTLDAKALENARQDLAARDSFLQAQAAFNNAAAENLASRMGSAQLNQRSLASAMPDAQALANRAADFLAARQKQ